MADDLNKISQLQHYTINVFASLFFKLRTFIHMTLKSKFPFYHIIICLKANRELKFKFVVILNDIASK